MVRRAPGKTPDSGDDRAVQEAAEQLLQGRTPQEALAVVLDFAAAARARAAQAAHLEGATDTCDDPSGDLAELPDPPGTPALLTVRVELEESEPAIWRRLQLRGDLTLDQVHGLLQPALGWTDSHLHGFELPHPARRGEALCRFSTDVDLAEGEQGVPESQVRLDQVLGQVGDRLCYRYDFGDGWTHWITVEQLRDATPDDPPAWCLQAVGACPPEDVGGIVMWNQLAAALRADPDPRALSGDLEMYADWLPAGIDPDTVDVDDINVAMALGAADANDLLAALGIDPATVPPVPPVAPALAGVIEKADPGLVVEIAALIALAGSAERPPQEAELRALLLPWQVLLDLAGTDGVALTPAGWMAPAACEVLWRDGGLDWGYGKGNREQHTPELRIVREQAKAAGLIRKRGNRLLRTKLGTRAATDLDVLVDAFAAGLLKGTTRGEPAADERAVTLLLIASGWEPDPDDETVATLGQSVRWRDQVAALLSRLGWTVNGAPLSRYDLREAGYLTALLSPRERGLLSLGGAPAAAGRYVAARAILAEGAATPAG